jgi:uncharacterized membrane protein
MYITEAKGVASLESSQPKLTETIRDKNDGAGRDFAGSHSLDVFMNPNYVFAFAIGIGVVAGLRSLTAPAVVSWAAHFGWLNLYSSPFAFMSSTVAVAIFSLLAIGELVADKLPKTPKRTAPAPFIARILTGALCGACLCVAASQSLFMGTMLGAMGGVIGTFGGYEIRKRLVSNLNIKDIFIAIPEDLIAISLACLFVSR